MNARFYRDGDHYIGTRLEQNQNQVEQVFRRNDAGELYDKYGTDAITHLDEVDEGVASNIRGQIGEEVLQPTLATRKYGRGGFDYDAEAGSGTITRGYLREDDIPFDVSGQSQGFDGLAVTDSGNLVIIETKVKGKTSRITNTGWLGDRTAKENRQLSEEWIGNKFNTLVKNADSKKQKTFIRRLANDDGLDIIDISERGGEIDLVDVNYKNIKTELIAYQDGKPCVLV